MEQVQGRGLPLSGLDQLWKSHWRDFINLVSSQGGVIGDDRPVADVLPPVPVQYSSGCTAGSRRVF